MDRTEQLAAWERTIQAHRAARTRRQLSKESDPGALLLWAEMTELAATLLVELRIATPAAGSINSSGADD